MKKKASTNWDQTAKSIRAALKEIIPISDVATIAKPRKGVVDLVGKDGVTIATIKVEAAGAAKAKPAKAKPAAPAKPEMAKARVKRPSARRSRKNNGTIRLERYWGVFNQNLKRVAVFDYADRKLADQKGAELSVSSKRPHFVQLIKEIENG